MDDEDFDDLLAGVEIFRGSSQESLTNAAANLDIDIASQSTAPTSISSQAGDDDFDIKHRANSHRSGIVLSESFTSSKAAAAQHEEPLTPAGKIEHIFRGIRDALETEDDEVVITLRCRASTSDATSRPRHIRFPGKTEKEAWRFTVLLRIMELMHEAMRNDVVLSKRDVYYRDPALFGNKNVVNRYVDSIAYTLNVPRAMLHVTAAAKGLVAGAFNICRRDGSIISAANEREGMLIPMLRDVLSINMSAVEWILVIEKEASLRSIAASSFWEEVSTRGVIMTGKGYPDIATRALLHFMTTASPQNGFACPPVFCLVDFDPDGLAIMSTYKNGSRALAHENEDLRVPQMQWLGLRSDALAGRSGGLHADQGLLTLTARDRNKAISMLARSEADATDAHELEVRAALQAMLMLNTKAELQLLDATPCGMVDLLTSALSDLE